MSTIDLSHNRALAMRAKLSITDSRAQQLVANWLLVHPRDQATADRNARMVTACAGISGTNTDAVGDWNALAHCLTLSLYREDQDWMMEQAYLLDTSRFLHMGQAIQDVFGTQFVGNEFVDSFDRHGDAMIVARAGW